MSRNVGICHFSARVDYRHTESGFGGVVKENRMHRLPQRIVAAESKRKVADSSTCFYAREMQSDPVYGVNERFGISVVFRHAGGNCKNVGVDYDVAAVESAFF